MPGMTMTGNAAVSLPDPVAIQSSSTIAGVFATFEHLIRPADIKNFKSSSSDTLKNFVYSIEQEQEQQGCQQNLRRLEQLFEGLESLSRTLQTLAGASTDTRLLYGPILLILQIVEKHPVAFGKFIECWREVGKNLPCTSTSQRSVDKYGCYEAVILDTCKDILELHATTYHIVRRAEWSRLFGDLWKSFGIHSRNIIRRLALSSTLLAKSVSPTGIAEAHASRQSLLDNLLEALSVQRERQLSKSLTWLGVQEQEQRQDALLERLASARQPGTCEWLLQNKKLSAWLDEDGNDKVLWLKGKPGSGKTTLVTYLIEKAELPHGALMLYCICSHGFAKAEAQPASLAYRSLITQIVRHRSDLLPFLYGQITAKLHIATFKLVKQMLKDLLQCVEYVYIVVDGVDECERVHQSDLTQELLALTGTRSVDTTSNVRLLICSRETREITRKLCRKPSIFLTEESDHVSHDIELFTLRRIGEIDELGKFEASTLEDVRKQILHKANGMFLWVQLVLSELELQESEHYLRKTLEELPSDINSVYNLILKRIKSLSDKTQQKQAKHILGLLTFAYRPLRYWELCDALVLHDCDLKLSRLTQLGKGILEICKPLVEERGDDTYALVHFSVREYLTQASSGPYLDSAEVHHSILCCCIRYLLSCAAFTNTNVEATVSGDIVRGMHNLYPYVHEFWISHLKQILGVAHTKGSEEGPTGELSLLLNSLMQAMFPEQHLTELKDAPEMPAAEQAEATLPEIEPSAGNTYGNTTVDSGSSALMGNTYNSVNIVGGVHLYCRDNSAGTGNQASSLISDSERLVAKACGDHSRAAPLVLPRQLEEYIEYRDLQRSKSKTAGKNNAKHVKKDHSGDDPSLLSVAYATYQCEFENLIEGALTRDFSQMKITREQLEEFRVRHRKYAFRCRLSGCPAASSGFSDAKERERHESLHRNQIVCTFDDCDDTFRSRQQLQIHINKYHMQVEDVKIPKFPTLKTKIAGDFEAKELEYFLDRTKLARACARGDMELVKATLLTEPETVDTSDLGGLTPLHIAAVQGYAQIVEILLLYTANINTKDLAGNTPLISAARNGHFAVIKLLHANGAYLETTNEDDLSAYEVVPEGSFHYAAIRRLLDFHVRTAHMVKKTPKIENA